MKKEGTIGPLLSIPTGPNRRRRFTCWRSSCKGTSRGRSSTCATSWTCRCSSTSWGRRNSPYPHQWTNRSSPWPGTNLSTWWGSQNANNSGLLVINFRLCCRNVPRHVKPNLFFKCSYLTLNFLPTHKLTNNTPLSKDKGTLSRKSHAFSQGKFRKLNLRSSRKLRCHSKTKHSSFKYSSLVKISPINSSRSLTVTPSKMRRCSITENQVDQTNWFCIYWNIKSSDK